ncbi:hypothetical protein BDV38DRAFT_291643 [Aspergillus pseudotamarii]|uniref:Uncharacterized protein n=1 Tax=Aspergillus pseudotamarii TaxID=132259 RepID=A0A5N6SW32_ASPPS|nr:uncharacterized protein BDV38DRAFT_291643 [Aspergillus pseudotamarii]KAE8138898.1 hypothetical protein BDV38DRAFT_291643 [Aspergillus pseudotamarii]
MADKPSYFTTKAGQYALGANRGPLAQQHVDGSQVAHVELAGGSTVKGRGRLRRHWTRFWCCYLIGAIIFLAIFLPLFFTVIIQAISQRVIDNASLVLVEAKIMQPRPESVLLSIQTALKLTVDVPVRLDPNVLHLFNNDQPGNSTYLKVYNDAIVIHGNTSIGVQNQPSPINPDPWKHYVRSVVFEPHAPLSAFGTTNIYLGKLKSHITMKKDLPQNTLNSFAGFSIDDPKMLFPPRDDGVNLVAHATLPNPSVMTIEIGTITMDLKSKDLIVGNATIKNLTLRPGNHSTPLEGVVDMHTIMENLLPLLQAQGSSLRDGYLSLDAVTREVEYDGVVIPYYTEVMRDLVLSAKVPVNDLLINSVQGILHDNSSDLQSVLDDVRDRHAGKGDILSTIDIEHQRRHGGL